MKTTLIIKLSLVYLLLFSEIALGGSHESGHHGGGSHGFGTHGSNSHGTNGGGVISGCNEKSVYIIKQSILVLVLKFIIAFL